MPSAFESGNRKSGWKPGWQVWIEKAEPAPFRRIVITYKSEPGSPQFRADLLEWDFSPDVPDSLFTFKRPAGAEQVPLVAKTKGEEEAR